jgi:hypothetical protein
MNREVFNGRYVPNDEDIAEIEAERQAVIDFINDKDKWDYDPEERFLSHMDNVANDFRILITTASGDKHDGFIRKRSREAILCLKHNLKGMDMIINDINNQMGETDD